MHGAPPLPTGVSVASDATNPPPMAHPAGGNFMNGGAWPPHQVGHAPFGGPPAMGRPMLPGAPMGGPSWHGGGQFRPPSGPTLTNSASHVSFPPHAMMPLGGPPLAMYPGGGSSPSMPSRGRPGPSSPAPQHSTIALGTVAGMRGNDHVPMGPGANWARPHALPPHAPGSPPRDHDEIRFRAEWEEASTNMDNILRGPADYVMQNPSAVQCRLCGNSLTGNIVADQHAVCNHRLVSAMDFSWETAERFFSHKTELQRQSLVKEEEVKELRNLIKHVRADYPVQVHAYVNRVLTAPRERIRRLQSELNDLKSIENLSGYLPHWEDYSSHAGAGKHHAAHHSNTHPTADGLEPRQAPVPEDVEWSRFRESVDLMVKRYSLARQAPVPGPAGDLARRVFRPPPIAHGSGAVDSLLEDARSLVEIAAGDSPPPASATAPTV